MSWKDWEFYQRNPDTIPLALSTGLNRGQIVLMLGAGVSQGFRLPGWYDLVLDVCNQLNPEIIRLGKDPVETSDFDRKSEGKIFLRKMSFVRKRLANDRIYLASIKNALYRRWESPNIFSAPGTLRAIGMLIAGSKRGTINDVLNFNFDSVLEWYLAEHGVVSTVIEDLPKNFIEADVRIYHPHGYLPLSTAFGTDSGMVIFDEDVARKRMASREDPWMDFYRVLLSTRKFIAIGLGFNDPMVEAALVAAQMIRDAIKDEEPLGFWICKKSSLNSSDKDSLNSLRIVVVEVEKFSDIRIFIQSIIKQAVVNVKF